ncbi:N-acetylmuramoyl-L-alanine amidase [Tropicimonas sp.]|uniref:N-acetylmuramoyl-L-alanine amidase n=1 Tax=Tropicimonas sp. TaxID=2067044 RepID=UPI003A87C70E
MEIVRRRSPNFGERRGGAVPVLVVLHYTAMPDAQSALDRLCDPAAEVSSHYLIGRDGACWQLVDDDRRAWHAGSGAWAGHDDVNSRSIGIELDNDGASPFPEPLMAALEGLLPPLMARWRIPPEGVIGHSDMAPARKSDPGPRFDWARLALRGLACWPRADIGGTVPDEAGFLRDLTAFGYPDDVAADVMLATFRSRFRPWADGPLDATDMGLARDLASRFPIDRARATD